MYAVKAHTGNIPFPSFASWADAGGMSEEELNHAEVLGSSDRGRFQSFKLRLSLQAHSRVQTRVFAQGNIAQRCYDSLHEEKCLVEAWLARTVGRGGSLGDRVVWKQVLGTVDGMTVQGMVSQYAENLKAGALHVVYCGTPTPKHRTLLGCPSGSVNDRIVEKAAAECEAQLGCAR